MTKIDWNKELKDYVLISEITATHSFMTPERSTHFFSPAFYWLAKKDYYDEHIKVDYRDPTIKGKKRSHIISQCKTLIERFYKGQDSFIIIIKYKDTFKPYEYLSPNSAVFSNFNAEATPESDKIRNNNNIIKDSIKEIYKKAQDIEGILPISNKTFLDIMDGLRELTVAFVNKEYRNNVFFNKFNLLNNKVSNNSNALSDFIKTILVSILEPLQKMRIAYKCKNNKCTNYFYKSKATKKHCSKKCAISEKNRRCYSKHKTKKSVRPFK